MNFADLFTEEATTRPLFDEVSSAQEREDPFSGPQGFMIGGEFLPGRRELSEQYFDAAYLLLYSIKSGKWEDYKLVNPALFLFRHAIELQVKCLLAEPVKTHDLEQLAQLLDAKSQDVDRRPAPRWIIARLHELAAVDPQSTSFRYAETYDRARKRDVPVSVEACVSVPHLQRAMLALYAALISDLPGIARQYPLGYSS